MLINTITQHAIMIELQLMFILTAIADVAVRTEAATSDELLILWCLIGGLGGSICSLHFYPCDDRSNRAWQFIVNIICAAIFSPFLCDHVSYWTRLPLGLRMALPVAFGVGFFGCQAITQGLPYAKQYYRARWKRAIKDVKDGPPVKKEDDDDSDYHHPHSDHFKYPPAPKPPRRLPDYRYERDDDQFEPH